MTNEKTMQASETAIANAISEAAALKPEQADQAFNCGMRSAKIKESNFENLNTYAATLGKNPSYATYEACRIQWVSGYVSENPNNTGEAADKAFHTFARQLKEMFGLDKPSSGNPVAKKKAEQRANKKAELLAEYKDETIAELNDRIKANFNTLSVQPSNKDAKKTIAELEKVIKEKQAEHLKAVGAELKELKEEATKEIKACMNVTTLEQVIELLIQSE
jgi:vacuolar-type H+-ATPase subunit I/STV1